jgi:hypothetical protein
MNNKFTSTIFLLAVICFNSQAQIFKRNVPEKPEENILAGRIFQVLLFTKENADSSLEENNDKNYFSEFKGSLTNNKVILSFENGSVNSTWIGKNKFEECSKTIITQNGNIIAFTSNCISSTCVSVKALWTGIVKRNMIHGTFCWVLPDGKSVNYAFYGKERKRSKGPYQKINSVPLVNN